MQTNQAANIDEEDQEIEYLENRINELLEKLSEKYEKKMRGDTSKKDNYIEMSAPKLMGSFELEKAKLDAVIREFVASTKKSEEVFEGDDELTAQYKEEKMRYEAEFVRLNCEIQDIRSENETLVDQIRVSEDQLKEMDREILEKNSLVKLFQDRLFDMNSSSMGAD